MNMKENRHGYLENELNALEKTFMALGIDFYLIGAVAREVWYLRGGRQFRSTKDIDFAVLVSNETEYDTVRQYLVDKNHFTSTKENPFVLISPGGIQVDILPFGKIAERGSVEITGSGMTSICVDGFEEVYFSGTAEANLGTGHLFKVATLPAIVLLKLIAFDDRPENRIKDARDIANIITCFFELAADLIYHEDHLDIFSGDEDILEKMSLSEISAIVIGRELKRIVGENKPLLERLTSILRDMKRLRKTAFLSATW